MISLTALCLTWAACVSHAQQNDDRMPGFRYGIHFGLNTNAASFGRPNPQPGPLNASVSSAVGNTHSAGFGGFGGLSLQYLSRSWWGIHLGTSFDMRDVYTTPNSEYVTRMSYLTIEPALRIDQRLIPNVHLLVGGLLAFNTHGANDFTRDAPSTTPEHYAQFPDRKTASLGVSGSIGYDIGILTQQRGSIFLTPFMEYSWLSNQRTSVLADQQAGTDHRWYTHTVRLGARIAWAVASTQPELLSTTPPVFHDDFDGVVPGTRLFSASLPLQGTILTKHVTGYFPLMPYVFFDSGSTDIPNRYTVQSKTEAMYFDESGLAKFMKGDFTDKETNINELMVAYYNIINIYADRMRKNTHETLMLRGSDPNGTDGEVYANRVRTYMIETYGIDASRITVSVDSPIKPSGSVLSDQSFRGLIDAENRRVQFLFSSDEMYKALPYSIRDESSIDNDMVFTITTNINFRSWTIRITGENRTMTFGPYKGVHGRINPAPLMRGLEKGTFSAEVLINLQSGRQVADHFSFGLVKGSELKNASRYLMIFDYNKSDAILTYETRIRKEIVAGMVAGNSVIIHGHTDIIGEEQDNTSLSQRRADEAKRIVDDELMKTDKNASVSSIGIGPAIMQYTFNNSYPEGRLYNRNVFVEVIR